MKRTREHLNSLTGLRGLAAGTVFLAHANVDEYFLPLGKYPAFFKWHNGAVDLFFVLSGFTLAYVYIQDGSRKINYRDYAIARYARIFPLYFITLAAATLLLVLPSLNTKYGWDEFVPDFLLQLVMINAWPLIGNSTFFNVPSWSISIEMFCYVLVFPLMAAVYRRENHNPGFAALSGVVLMAVSFLLYRNFYNSQLFALGDLDGAHPMSYWVNIFRGILGFSAGYIAYFSFLEKDQVFQYCGKFADYIFLLFVLTLLAGHFNLLPGQHLFIILAPFLCLACAGGHGYVNRLLGGVFFKHVGDLSYSIYLWHIIVISFLSNFIIKGSFVSGAILIAAVYFVSLISFNFFESPMRKYINSIQEQSASRFFSRVSVVALSTVILSSGILIYSNYRMIRKSELSPGFYLVENWHAKEKYGAWSSDLKATIKVARTERNSIEIPVVGYFDGYLQKTDTSERAIKLYINDVLRNILRFEDGQNRKILKIDSDFSRQDTLITFEIPDIRSPSSLGISSDERRLGVFIEDQIRFQ